MTHIIGQPKWFYDTACCMMADHDDVGKFNDADVEAFLMEIIHNYNEKFEGKVD